MDGCGQISEIGTVTFDSENPGTTKGKIVVAANSLTLPNSMQQGHMRGDKWMDVAKYPRSERLRSIPRIPARPKAKLSLPPTLSPCPIRCSKATCAAINGWMWPNI